ncbi:MAG: hemin receptor [Flavobacteriaceae bacterium]|nr:hemin receptor [Flavobacteriaceae bacterium]
MTKKISILAGISASALFFAQDVSIIRNTSTIYDNISSLGTARYSAMAGSMGALGGDASVLNTNPAGLGVFITDDVSASLAINSNKSTASLAGKSTSQNTSKVNLGSANGVLSFQTKENSAWKFVNVGINYVTQNVNDKLQSPGNANITQAIIPQGQTSPSDYNIFEGHLYETIGHRSKLNLGIGGNYDNKIYIGAAVNFSSVNIEQYDEVKVSSTSTRTSKYLTKQNTPYIEEGDGFSLSLGVIGKLNNAVRLGAAIESPTWYSIDREYNYYGLNGSILSINGYTENRTFRTPTKLTLSGAFIPNKHFAFNVDYRVDLGKPNFGGGAADVQLNNFYESTYKAQHEVRIGGEYRIKSFRVRGGYAFTTSPFKDHTETMFDNNANVVSGKLSNYIVGKTQVISGGIGYDFKMFYIDASYQHRTHEHSNPFYAGSYFNRDWDGSSGNNSASTASIVSNAKNQKGQLILTLGWKF